MKDILRLCINNKIFIVLLCLVFGFSVTESTFRYEDCSDNATAIFQINDFTIEPDPIDLMNNMSITANIEVLKSITNNFTLKTTHYRMTRVFGYSFDIPLPCIASKFGSCILPACTYLDSFQKNVCPFFPDETECKCPVEEGIYGGKNVQIRIGYIPFLGRLLVQGRYRTEIRITESATENQTEVACFKIFTEVE